MLSKVLNQQSAQNVTEDYLTSSSMRSTSSSLALASSVLGFEIVELWSKEQNESLKCTYIHVSNDVMGKYPGLIQGHYPNHKKEHQLSPHVSIYIYNRLSFLLN
jgi:hypothetical protein